MYTLKLFIKDLNKEELTPTIGRKIWKFLFLLEAILILPLLVDWFMYYSIGVNRLKRYFKKNHEYDNFSSFKEKMAYLKKNSSHEEVIKIVYKL